MARSRWSVLALSLSLAEVLAAALPMTAAPRDPGAYGGGAAAVTAPAPAATPAKGLQRGKRLLINGQEQQAAWQLTPGSTAAAAAELWLPLEVLQGQLGVSSRSRPDGSLELEWYGRTELLPPGRQRSLDDEVAVEVGGLLRAVGVGIEARGDSLRLSLAPARLIQVRSSRPGGPRRIVLDLDGPTLVRSEAGVLQLELTSSVAQQQALLALGLNGRQSDGRLTLPLPPAQTGATARVFTLGGPPRVVIDLPAGANEEASAGPAVPPLDPRLQALLGSSVVWEQRVLPLGSGSVRLNAVSIDPRSAPLELRPLRRDDSMEGLSLLPNLARRWDALVAINGGFFNRVRRLPLGALREQGRWLSGPILNRGAVGWSGGDLPRFGRLQLQESLLDSQGGRWPLTVLNSGYVQKGLSRYTADWGPWYRALSDGESAVLLRGGMVVQRFEAGQLATGVPLTGNDVLIVGRGGSVPTWGVGQALQLDSRPNDPLGTAPNVIGGGPLLLQDGRLVLQGAAEGFSASFLSQGAPRTVVASDGQRLLLLTLQGVNHPGPTLGETAVLLQRIGIRDALNLDGGSSTGLVMGGNQTVRGRGVTAAIHNGLGLVLRQDARPGRSDWGNGASGEVGGSDTGS